MITLGVCGSYRCYIAVLSLDEDSYLLTDEVCMSVVGVGISGSKASPVTTIIARTVGALWCIMILLIDIS